MSQYYYYTHSRLTGRDRNTSADPMASGSAYDGDDSPPIEDREPDSPDTVLVPSANIMRFPTMNMDGTAPLPSAPARGELVHAHKPSAPVPNVGAGVPEPINLRRFCELLQVGSALRAPCASDDAHGFGTACARHAAEQHYGAASEPTSSARGLFGRSVRAREAICTQAGACGGYYARIARRLSIRLPAPTLPRLRLLASAASRMRDAAGKNWCKYSFIHNADLGLPPCLGCCDGRITPKGQSSALERTVPCSLARRVRENPHSCILSLEQSSLARPSRLMGMMRSSAVATTYNSSPTYTSQGAK